MAAAVWEDERVVRGMGVHLQAQRDKGGTRIGWKMGLGLPAVMERLGTPRDRKLVVVAEPLLWLDHQREAHGPSSLSLPAAIIVVDAIVD